MSEPSERVQRALDEVNDYQQTVKALLAFAAFAVHDGTQQRPGAAFGFGRRMTASAQNRVSPDQEVTPDLVAQKSGDYGIVAEGKKSLPRDQTRWERYVEQLLKYDDELTGWWTQDGTIPQADTVMLVHQSRSRVFCRFLEQKQSEDPHCVGEHSSVVEFNSSDETASYYFFRLEHGTIRDEELAARLQDGIPIPLDKVLQSFPNLKYYDSKPPLAFILKELWMETFPAMLEGAEYDEKYAATKVAASVEEVTEELQKAHGSDTLSKDSRSVEFPSQSWVREAFEKLVQLKMALPPSEPGDPYQILFKSVRGDVLKRFIELTLGIDQPAASGADGLLPFPDPETPE